MVGLYAELFGCAVVGHYWAVPAVVVELPVAHGHRAAAQSEEHAELVVVAGLAEFGLSALDLCSPLKGQGGKDLVFCLVAACCGSRGPPGSLQMWTW